MGDVTGICKEVNVWEEGCSSVVDAEQCDPHVASERFVATEDQTLFQLLSFTYEPGTDSLEVHRNGLLVDPLNIIEISSTMFFIQNENIVAGDIVIASALTGVTADIAINITNVSIESIVVIDGQLLVPFLFSIVGASIYINGAGVDTGRLIEVVDYAVDIGNNSITLVESYPAGTLVSIVYNDTAVGGNISSGADIADVLASINILGKFAGKSEVNSTNFHLVIATGSLAADDWIDQVDGATITPV